MGNQQSQENAILKQKLAHANYEKKLAQQQLHINQLKQQNINLKQQQVIQPQQRQQIMPERSTRIDPGVMIQHPFNPPVFNDITENQNNSLMKYQELTFSNIKPDNIADTYKNYHKQEEEIEKNFQENINKLKKSHEEGKNKRMGTFKELLQKFEEKHNPFKILEISYNASEGDIKKAYHKMALKYHPDKGGDPNKFRVITQSYLYLLEKFKEAKDSGRSHGDLRNEAKNFFESQQEQLKQRKINPVHFDKDKMDLDKFNKMFEENRLTSIYDKGYGGTWEDEPKIEKDNIFSDDFNLDVFNATFNKKKDIKNNQIIEYKAPQALVSSNLPFEEIGRDEINDFSSGFNDKTQFTDYKAAYTKLNTLEYDEKYKRKDFKNLDDLKRERDNIKYELSPEEKKRLEMEKYEEEQRDQKRMMNVMAENRLLEEHFQRMNQMFIKN